MMKIKFTVDHKVKQSDGNGAEYVKGKTYEFSGWVAETYARKYVAKGYATEVGEAPATVDAAKAEQAERERVEAERKAEEAAKFAARSAVNIPDDLEKLSWPELRALATSLTDDAVHNKGEAIAAVKAERGRRAIT